MAQKRVVTYTLKNKKEPIKMIHKILILILLSSVVFISCNKNKNNTQEISENSFDKKGLLENYATNIIIPNYNSFSIALDSLILTYNTFKTTESTADFVIVKQKLHSAYLKYQQINLYEFGPAEQQLVRANFNIFPTDSVQIKSNILAGSYNFQTSDNFDAKGFPALDYLFYDVNKTETQIIQSFVSTINKKKYVSDILTEMQTKTKTIVDSWNSSYKSQFINSLNTDIGSSIGFLINQLNYELDYLKNAKIGIPLGKKSLDNPYPTKCEAYYGQQSVQYAIATLAAIESMYLGKSSSGMDGIGFDDYLDHLKASYGSTSLNTAIKNQFNIVRLKLTNINGTLSHQIEVNPTVVNAAYAELVKLLVLLKTDLPSHLGVIITYQDGDGD